MLLHVSLAYGKGETRDTPLGERTGPGRPARCGRDGHRPERVGLATLRALPLKPAIRAVQAQLAANNFDSTPNTQLFNQTGQPAISLPLHWTPDGLPIGVQLAAAMGGEALLLRVAAQLEGLLPWADRRQRSLRRGLSARVAGTYRPRAAS